MYVCICRSVTDREIRHAVRAGACRMRDLREQLGVCNQCGKCAPSVRDLLEAGRADVCLFAEIKPA